MSSRAHTDAWRRPRHSFVSLNVDEAPIVTPCGDRQITPGDLYRDNRGRVIAVLGIGENHAPCVIFDDQGELMTVDRIGIHRLARMLRVGRLTEMPTWAATWGTDE